MNEPDDDESPESIPMPRPSPRTVRVKLVSGWEVAVDLDRCKQFPVTRIPTQAQLLNPWPPPPRDEVYYLLPDDLKAVVPTRWIRETDHSLGWSVPGAKGPILSHTEVHAVWVCHAHLVAKQQVPKPLRRWEKQATEPAFFAWLARWAGETAYGGKRPGKPAYWNEQKALLILQFLRDHPEEIWTTEALTPEMETRYGIKPQGLKELLAEMVRREWIVNLPGLGYKPAF
jgi:hypothetical protein